MSATITIKSLRERFKQRLMDKAKTGTTFNTDPLAWFNLIREHIAPPASIRTATRAV